MPTLLPPKRRRPTPRTDKEENDEVGETTIQVTIICMLLIANLALFCVKFAPPNNYALAAAPAEIELSP